MVAGGCGARDLPEVPVQPGDPIPGPGEVDRVVYFIGDPGKTRLRSHPILSALRSDVEAWSEALARDSSVVVVVLGDMVYPDGLDAPGTAEYSADSAYLASQARVVEGPAAREHALMYFVAGNHDWGEEEDWEGALRLGNLEAFLDTLRSTGMPVALEPKAGTGGPTVVDLGPGLRLILLDTAWWLLDANEEERTTVLARISEAVRTRGEREVVFAAHHPFESAGSHGGYLPFWRTFGIRYALARAGALLQDLNSRPYARLRSGLAQIFEEHGRPILFAGGHDHSLQIIRGTALDEPRYTLVAGSASKLTQVGHTQGMLLRRSQPGYMRLFVLRNGTFHLTTEAAPAEFLECPLDETDHTDCMRDGIAAYRTIWSGRIR